MGGTDFRDARYALVTAANHLLFMALPLREPDSGVALAMFLQAAAANPLPAADRHTVLVAILGVLNPHTGGRLPGLVERYVAKSAGRIGRLDVFAECVEDVIRYRGLGDRRVQRAVALIARRFADAKLTPTRIASELELEPSTFSRLFTQCTSVTPGAYIRNLRLDNAASRLLTTNDSVKDIWVAVGYNDAANFCHDFHDKFASSPSEYRARGYSTDQATGNAAASSASDCQAHGEPGAGKTVLIVDDNPTLCDTTRRLLARSGFLVLIALDGKTGLAEACSRPVDAILLDYRLPDLSGVDFLRTLRRQRPQPTPPVVIWTADWTIEERAAEITALNAGIASKLCDCEQLERLVTSYCHMPLKPA